MKNILILCCTLFIISCVQQNKNNTNIETIRVDKVFSENLSINLSDIVDTAKYIPLETREEFLIGTVSKVHISKDRIYILDSWQSKSLFVFNKSGKFLNKVGKLGKGPGEYLQPIDFEVDEINRKIYVLDLVSEKLFEYSFEGEFVKNVNVKEKAFFVKKVDKDYYAFYSLFSTGEKEQYFLNIKDFNNNSIKRYFKHDDKVYDNMMPGMCFYEYNNNIFYLPSKGEVIYKIKNLEPIPTYQLFFGNLQLPQITKDNKQEIESKKKEYCVPRRFGITSSVLWFNYHYNMKNYYAFYNKKLKMVLTGIINNNINGLPCWIRWSTSTCLITVVNANEFVDPESDLTEKFVTNNKNAFNGLDMKSNPVLCLYQLKK